MVINILGYLLAFLFASFTIGSLVLTVTNIINNGWTQVNSYAWLFGVFFLICGLSIVRMVIP